MARGIELDELLLLLDAGDAQLVEVLDEQEYRWAHLPGALHVPLKGFDDATRQLDRHRPVIAYCHDALCDLSPRAAAALERLGFVDVADFGPGKTEWLANGLPYEGTADLVGRHLSEVISVTPDDPVGEVAELLRQRRSQLAAVVFDSGVVAGSVSLDALEGREGLVTDYMRVGVSTVRPSEERAALAKRMERAEVTTVLVTTPSGQLLGSFSRVLAPA